jgi:hypothetical protein
LRQPYTWHLGFPFIFCFESQRRNKHELKAVARQDAARPSVRPKEKARQREPAGLWFTAIKRFQMPASRLPSIARHMLSLKHSRRASEC